MKTSAGLPQRAAAVLMTVLGSSVVGACGLVLGFDDFERVEGSRSGETGSTTGSQGGAGGTGTMTSGPGGGGIGGAGGLGGAGGAQGLPNGSACAASAKCQSGNCVDGVCCDTACDATCAACTTALKGGGDDGTCGPIAIDTDPENECEDETATNSCGQTGNCNGDSACAVVAFNTSCGDLAGCSSGTQTGADICDGNGNCVMGNDVTCEPYVCDAGGVMCLDMCNANADCISTHYCSAGNCAPKLMNGAVCQDAGQCQSGFCVDGRCCNTACNGLCQACSMAKKVVGANGVCGPIGTGTDPDNECGTECYVSNCNASSMCSALTQAPNGTPCGAGGTMMCQAGVCQ